METLPQRIVIPIRDDDDDDDDDYDEVVEAVEVNETFENEDDEDAVEEQSNGDLLVPVENDIEDMTEQELLDYIMRGPIDHEEVVENEEIGQVVDPADTPCPPRRTVKRRRIDFVAEAEASTSTHDGDNDQCLANEEELLDLDP